MSVDIFSNIVLVFAFFLGICCLFFGYLLLKNPKVDSHHDSVTPPILDDQLKEELTALKEQQSIEVETKAIGDIRLNLEATANQTSQLNDIVKGQTDNLLGMKEKAAVNEVVELNEEQVDQLIGQSEKSTELITVIKSEFDETIQKLAEQEEQLAKKNEEMAKVRDLIDQHQQVIGTNQHLAEQVTYLKTEIDQQSSLIDELQHKADLAVAGSHDKDAANVIEELEQSLSRAVREKEFIETHYLELEESTSKATSLMQDIEQSKQSLSLLVDSSPRTAKTTEKKNKVYKSKPL